MRHIIDIPENALLEHYVGKHLANFNQGIMRGYSPSSERVIDISRFAWELSEKSSITLSYTATKKSIYIRCKVIWDYGCGSMDWKRTHVKMVPLSDPNGNKIVEDFISHLALNHKDGAGKCCSNPVTWV